MIHLIRLIVNNVGTKNHTAGATPSGGGWSGAERSGAAAAVSF